MLNIDFITEFGDSITRLGRGAKDAAYYFKTIALADSYNYMVSLMDQRTATHPEVMRMPVLREMLLDYFITNSQKHIDPKYERIFNTGLVGHLDTLQRWQEAGYSRTKRSSKNYPQRLLYWKSIYDGTPLRKPIVGKSSKKNKRPPLPRTGDDIFSDHKQEQLYYEVNIKDRSGNIVTYESAIQSRNTNFGATRILIPFWYPLNYGSDSGLAKGYPAVPGLHFVEDAEKTIPQNLSRYARYMESFFLDSIENPDMITNDLFGNVDLWARRNIKVSNDYINVLDTAREIVYGLPF